MGNLLLQDSAISPAAVPAAAQSLARRKDSSQRGWPRLRCKKRIFVIAITSRVQSAALLSPVDCECHVRRFFLKTQPRPGGALLCAARFPALETSRYGAR